MKPPFFSIIAAVFNQGKFLRKNIESVMAQGLDDVEHIVVDGGSSDETIDVLKAYPHVRWISEPDRGQADALNKGVMMARGEIMSCLNGDDFYLPGAFDVVRRQMKGKTAETPVLTGGWKFIRNGIEEDSEYPPENVTLDKILRWFVHPISHPATFLSIETYKKAGWFNPNIRYAPDVEFWYRLIRIAPIKSVSDVLAACLRHDEAIGIKETEHNNLAILYYIANNCGDSRKHIFNDMCLHVLNDYCRNQQPMGIVDDLFKGYVRLFWENLGYKTRKSGKAVGIFCAGRYTKWILDMVKDLETPPRVYIFDDIPHVNRLFEFPVLRPSEVDASSLELVIVGTDTSETLVKRRIAECFGTNIPVEVLHSRFKMPRPLRKTESRECDFASAAPTHGHNKTGKLPAIYPRNPEKDFIIVTPDHSANIIDKLDKHGVYPYALLPKEIKSAFKQTEEGLRTFYDKLFASGTEEIRNLFPRSRQRADLAFKLLSEAKASPTDMHTNACAIMNLFSEEIMETLGSCRESDALPQLVDLIQAAASCGNYAIPLAFINIIRTSLYAKFDFFAGNTLGFFKTAEALGLHILPVHFYSPVPTSLQVKRFAPAQYGRTGLRLNQAEQIKLLESLHQYSREIYDNGKWNSVCESIPKDSMTASDYYLYYSIIRKLKPKRVIELGAGKSTMFASLAIKKSRFRL